MIRLNKKTYDENKFEKAGIKHFDIYFKDGSCPTAKDYNRFIDACESVDGAIAIHCKAGLGRTGTMLGND